VLGLLGGHHRLNSVVVLGLLGGHHRLNSVVVLGLLGGHHRLHSVVYWSVAYLPFVHQGPQWLSGE